MLLTTVALIYSFAAADPHATAAIPILDPFSGAVPVRAFSFEWEEDADYDRVPDYWSRRRGPEFPGYVKVEMERGTGKDGRGSLLIEANGGAAVIYSPAISIDANHSWLLDGAIRTRALKHDAAMISLSFLNHRRQRIQRVLTRPVTGTHNGWYEVRIGPVSPPRGARYAVIGCHMAPGRKSDIGGAAWFDAIRLMKLPQMELISNFQTHFRHRSAEVEVTANVSGLDDGEAYRILMQIHNSAGELLMESMRDVVMEHPAVAETPGSMSEAAAEAEEERRSGRQSVSWKMPAFDYGYYEIRAELQRATVPILESQTSFAVLDLVEEPMKGEFGWSLDSGYGRMSLRELADISIQSGINWLKLPLWQSAYDSDKEKIGAIIEFFDRISHRGITPVGLLNDPPPEIRQKFVRNWTGISEIFAMPTKFWSPSLAPVLARYSSSVRYWQLGDDSDTSFVGMKRFSETLQTVKNEFDGIGRDTRIGVRWDWNSPLPSDRLSSSRFLSLGADIDQPPELLKERLKKAPRTSGARWALVRPLSRSRHSTGEQASDLVKQMVAARIGGADAIFASDVLHPDHGILNLNGSPTRLFLPWRTTAVALQGSEYLGSFELHSESTNHIFVRGGEMMMILWNPKQVTETIYLGEDVVASDIWGRQNRIPVDPRTGRQSFDVGPEPLTIRGGSEAIARWRLETRFEKGQVPSAYGEHDDAILGVNPFPQGANGQVTVQFPPDWVVEPNTWPLQVAAGEKFRLPMKLTLPANANLGGQTATIRFDIVADRPYVFTVHRPIQVGLGDIDLQITDRKLSDGRLEVQQLITNSTSPPETLDFRCSLFVPGKKRQVLFVTKLGQGEDRKIYRLPNADELKGKELWIRAEQVNGRKVLNYRWKIGKAWDLAP